MKSGYRIGELREKRGMSQRELGDAIGVTQQTIGYYESGRSDPKASVCISLASALHVSVTELLGIQDDYESALSPNEQHLVTLYRSANEQGKSAIMAIAENQAGDVARRAAPPGIESTA